MGKSVIPKSLRSVAGTGAIDEFCDTNSGVKVSAVAGLIAVASFSTAEAQQQQLPSVNVEAPVARPKPTASKPTADQVRARQALRRAAQQQQQNTQAPAASNLPADRSPYANPASPYEAEHLQASGKFPERVVNTAR
jgi:catecholate siderophore receptor